MTQPTFYSLGGIGQTFNGPGGQSPGPVPCSPLGAVSTYAYGNPDNDDVLYVGSEKGLWLRPSLPQGGLQLFTLQSCDDVVRDQAGTPQAPYRLTSYPGSQPIDIAMHPWDWKRVYVLDGAGRIWLSPDASAANPTWADLSGNLPQLSPLIRTISVFADTPFPDQEILIAGGQGGVFIREVIPHADSSQDWRVFGNTFPNSLVWDLSHNTDLKDDLLVAGTLGRSMKSMSDPQSWFHVGVGFALPKNQNCSIALLAGNTVTLQGVVSGLNPAGLSWQWSIAGAVVQGSLTQQNVTITLPNPPAPVTARLAATDLTYGRTWSSTKTFTPASIAVGAGEAGLCNARQILCARHAYALCDLDTPLFMGDPPPDECITTPDINGDGRPDLVISSVESNSLAFYLSSGDVFLSPQQVPLSYSPSGIASADLNGDYVPDIALVDPTGGLLSVWLGGASAYSAPSYQLAIPAGSSWVRLFDANYDYHTDIVVFSRNGTAASILYNNGNGTFQAPVAASLRSTSFAVNGGLESGDLTGWTTSGTASITGAGHGGSYTAQVGSTAPTNGDSSISQTVDVPACGGEL